MGEFTVERRVVVPLARIPHHLIQAFLAAEDKRFFAHDGVDYVATGRAFLANALAGRTVQGASTLTQQLCKTLVGREKSYVRKAREAILARRTEAVLSKLEILRLYLNQIYLGHGAYGVQAAARNYFGKDVFQLDLAEAAMLAGLPPQPGKLNPVLDPKGARRRQRYVLDRMVEEGFITRAEADTAFAEPLDVKSEQPSVFDEGAPYYAEHVRKEIQARYGYDALNGDGLRVYLAVDADRQRAAQGALQDGLHAMGDRQGYAGPIAHLEPDETDDFVARASALYHGPEALAEGAWYFALVDAVEKSGAQVRIGALQATLPLKRGASWAMPFDIEAEANTGHLTDVRDALKPGDVVLVRHLAPKGEAADATPAVRLGQIPPVQGALMALEAGTGHVSAMVGGFDFDQSEYNRAFQGCRQPGSVFKPIVYSLALDRDYTLATPIDDTPITVYDRKEQYIWKPRNFGGQYKGAVLLRDALIHSMNIPAIRVIRHVGPDAAAEWAAYLGITTPMYPDQSLVLGSSCVYPWDMVQVYATFAARGRRPRPVFIRRVEDRDGRVLEDRTHFADPWAPVSARLDGMLRAAFEPPPRALSEQTAYLMQTALAQVVESGTAVKARKLGKPAGGKTGTTDAYDAWFLGFTEGLTTGVWVGSDHNKRKLGKGETGGKVALPIWLRFMQAALEDVPQDAFTDALPEGIEYHRIDVESGLLAPSGNRALNLPFRQGTEPTEFAREAGSFDNRDLDLVEGRF
ncbi:MAG: PBP1A family penicillin-binding protein [Myxococcales bacterium]|nr:PBP1A family penicillin-binding protein [Myxococcales bacterium]